MIKRRKRLGIRLELAPLIDIVFVLLIFFAVSTTLSEQKGLHIQLPQSQTADSDQKGMVLSIDDHQVITIDNQILSVGDLQAFIANQVILDPLVRILIQADKKTSYELVVQILDKIRLGGCYDIILETHKKA